MAPRGVLNDDDDGGVALSEQRRRGEDFAEAAATLRSSLLRSVTEWKVSRNRPRLEVSIFSAKSKLFLDRSVTAGDFSNPDPETTSTFSSRSSTFESRSRDPDPEIAVGDFVFRAGFFELRSDP